MDCENEEAPKTTEISGVFLEYKSPELSGGFSRWGWFSEKLSDHHELGDKNPHPRRMFEHRWIDMKVITRVL